MTKNIFKVTFTVLIGALLAITLSACGENSNEKSTALKEGKVPNRWYSVSQKIKGERVFKDNCVVCHGEKAKGLTENWKQPLPDGSFSAPPLNGSAHAWHHSKDLLLRTVNNGGVPLGGTMPAFKDQLSDADKEAAIAYITSLWSDEIYKAWITRNPL